MGRIFGTDGIRGVAGVDMTPELALDLGRAAATVVKERGNTHPHFLIGRDTRISGGMLESAIAAGLCSVGADVTLLGVITTPGVAYLARKYQADGAFVISASHNPYEYNGIKLFDAEGYKFPDSYEEEIEELILDDLRMYALVDGQDFGRIRVDNDARTVYVEYLASTAPARAEGIRVLVDCANGAASTTARELFTAIGADFTIINDTPDGININVDCGSTHIEQLCPRVVEGGYDLGIAFDGDADRIIAVDERGEVVDGDMLLAVFACYLISQDKLAQRTLVGTVMSNIGLLKFGEMSDVHIETTKVGDRYVLERMREQGYNLGGEQSGHITFLDYMPTGDAQLCAVQLLGIMAKTGLKLSELAAVMKKYPQVLVNVKASQQVKDFLPENRPVQELIAECEAQLGSRGRVLVRPSGTEPLIRVMLEGEDLEEITGMAQRIAEKIEESL